MDLWDSKCTGYVVHADVPLTVLASPVMIGEGYSPLPAG